MSCIYHELFRDYSMDSIDMANIDGVEYIRQVKKRNQMKILSSITQKVKMI